MPVDDVSLVIQGFDRGSKFGIFVKDIVDKIHLEAPSDANITASFTKFESLISGAIQISSSQGVFSASSQGLNARAVALRIFHEIESQLKIWKRRRWSDEAPQFRQPL